MCYLAHAPAVARIVAGHVEVMGRAVRPPEALRGLQRRLSMRSAHRETQIAQEAVRESRVRRHRAARRALGKAHPLTRAIETGLLSSGVVLANHTRTLYSDELDEVETPLEELDEVEDA